VISRRHAIAAGGLTMLLAACATPARVLPEDGTIDLLSLLRGKPEHARFIALLDASGQASRIGRANGPVTLFVPTNENMARLPAATLALIDRPAASLDATQRASLVALVQANAAFGLLRLLDIQPRNGRVVTWDRARVTVTATGPRSAAVARDGAPAGTAPVTITRADVLASDGVFHITSGLILPG